MKKIMIWLAVAMLPLTIAAQQTDFDQLFDKYSGVEGYTTLVITSDMVKLMENREGSRTFSAFDQVEQMRVVSAGKDSAGFVEDIGRLVPGFTLMSSVNETGQQTNLYRKRSTGRDKPSEFLIVVYGKKENMAIHIIGNLAVKSIGKP